MKQNSTSYYIAIVALISSIIAIGIIFFKSEISFSFIEISIGLLGSIIGALLSIAFSYFVRKRAKAKVFIAYSYNDNEIAHKLIATLDKNHFKVITQEEIGNVGEPTEQLTRQAIKEVGIIIVVVSKEFYKSKSIKRLIDYSKSMHKKILPVLIEDVELPNSLSNLQYIDTTKDFDKATDDLINKILKNFEK